jgi:hypothetical protein
LFCLFNIKKIQNTKIFDLACLLEVAIMSEFVIAKDVSKDNKPHKDEINVNLDTKTIVTGSGNIIGKSVIQEFFTCTGTLVSIDIPILKRTNSYA